MSGTQYYSSLERAVLHRLAESTGRLVDTTYASLVHQLGITQRFFQEGGFGDLRVVDFHEEIKAFQSWPPPHFDSVKMDWRRVREDTYNGHAYSVFKATFPTLVQSSAYNALPIESRTAHALWIAPHSPAPGFPTVVNLAATGDHGFVRREYLGIPLVAHGVGSIALESPFYGARKPADQQGAKLRRVSDLLLLGRATIEESLFLLRWLGERGHTRLGISGLSMGGVHASMIAALYPGEVALSPLLAPRSAAQSYCQGALFHATAWDRLLQDTEGREAEIVEAVRNAAVAKERMAAARIRDASQQVVGTTRNDNNPTLTTQIDTETKSNHKEAQTQQWHWINSLKWMEDFGSSLESQIRKIRRMEMDGGSEEKQKRASNDNSKHASTVLLLEAVLETFTDATRFPVPRRPDAAVLVAATEDAYVAPQSVLDLHHHLPGSEIRWVPGGHVSSFLLHQPTFRDAIVDSLNKL